MLAEAESLKTLEQNMNHADALAKARSHNASVHIMLTN